MTVRALARYALMVAVFGWVTASCGRDPIELLPAETVNITVDEVSITEIDSPVRGTRAMLVVSIENRGSQSLFYIPCGDYLLREEGAEWREIWSRAVCSLGGDWSDAETEIPPGGSFTFNDFIAGRSGGLDAWTSPADGTYRVVILSLWGRRANLPDSAKSSKPFEVRVDKSGSTE
ncbi:MAG: hypothetical protein ACREM1_17345 [Longimicrobiales bacterium]